MSKRLKLRINLCQNQKIVSVNLIAFSTVIYYDTPAYPILLIINYRGAASCVISGREEILRNPPKPVERIDAYRICIPSLIIRHKTSRTFTVDNSPRVNAFLSLTTCRVVTGIEYCPLCPYPRPRRNQSDVLTKLHGAIHWLRD